MKQLVPLFSLPGRRVLCLSVVAVVALIAIRSTSTTHANRNQTSGQILALLGPPPSPLAVALTVNTLGDQADVSVGNGICDVDSGASGDQCTLRAAIQEANATFGADTIDFSVSGTINLTGALPEIVSDLAMNGPGSALLTVRRDTGGDYRIFSINNRVVTISGMTITNGRTPDGGPGASFGQSGGSGGGIQQVGGALTATDLVVTANRTGNGGVGGSSTGGWGGSGGGISCSGNLTMSNVTVSNNLTGDGATGNFGGSGGPGGGISFSGSSLTMTNCLVTGNTAGNGGNATSGSSSGNGGSGGGISAGNGTINLTNVVISGNHAGNGNPIIASGGGHGGGLLTSTGVTSTLTNCTISDNNTGQGGSGFSPLGGHGGGIMNHGPMTMIGCAVSGNFTKGPSSGGGGLGGGIFNGNVLTMTNCTVSNNIAHMDVARGGGIYNNAHLTLTNCTITGNQSNLTGFETGRGIHSRITANVKNTIIAGNGSGGPDVSGNYNSLGNNLVGKTDADSSGFTNGVNGDQVGTVSSPIDPLLGALSNNGGPTMTHPLLAGSPALDRGNNSHVTNPPFSGPPFNDQRGSGFSRIVDGPDPDSTATVDIGAYEKQAVFPNLPDASTNEDRPAIVAFDLDDIASVTSVTATASNSTLVPSNPSVVLVGSTAILTINPAANLSGTTDITVTVNRTSGSANATFVLTVVAVNDAPSFTKGPDQSVNENDPAQTVNNWATAISAGPADESPQAVTFQVVSNSNAGLFSAAPAISSNGTLTYTPATGMSGTALITIRLSDNGGTANGGSDTSATQSFNINVLEGGNLHFSSFSYNVSESGGSALITVSRSGGSAGEARVNYATSDGGATAGQDYTATSGTLTFAHGVTSQTFSVPILGDTFDENDFEPIALTLSSPAGSGGLGSPSTSTLNINDDDARPTLSINDVQFLEGNSGMTDAVFTVTLTGQTALQATVGFSTSNNTATLADYQPASGQLTFNPGETTKTVTVSVVGDTLGETNETFFVNLNFSINSNIIRFRGTGTILNDDPAIQLSSTTYSVNEGLVSASVTVNRTGDTSGTATVKYATGDTAGLVACSAVTGKASERCDYVTTIGTVTFAAGETSKNLVIPLIDDVWLEGNETLTITLSSPTGATLLSPGSATVTITDNDTSSGAANPIDGVEFFIRQMYRDILNRQPDSTGLQNWIDTLAPCPNGGFGEPPSSNCDRLHVASGFFQSEEFLNRGYFAFRFYMVSFGLRPTYAQFIPDMAQVGGPKSPAEEEAAKVAYADAFVQRPAFLAAYPGQSGQTLANSLLQTAGLPSGSYNAGSQTNGQILRGIAESSAAFDKFLTQGTVSILYFGFQRRDPDATGYQNNLTTLTADPNNLRHMIFIFIYSTEYRGRFGPN